MVQGSRTDRSRLRCAPLTARTVSFVARTDSSGVGGPARTTIESELEDEWDGVPWRRSVAFPQVSDPAVLAGGSRGFDPPVAARRPVLEVRPGLGGQLPDRTRSRRRLPIGRRVLLADANRSPAPAAMGWYGVFSERLAVSSAAEAPAAAGRPSPPPARLIRRCCAGGRWSTATQLRTAAGSRRRPSRPMQPNQGVEEPPPKWGFVTRHCGDDAVPGPLRRPIGR